MPDLDAFQHEVLAFMTARQGRCVYADPVGSRKTATTLTWLKCTDNVRHVLVVAPKAVHGHWVREAAQWAPSLDVFHAVTPAKRNAAILQAKSAPGIYLTSYESMKQDEKYLTSGFDTVVFDEGHRLKGRTTAVAKVSNAVTKNAAHVLIVTGTPVPNSADELWQYLHLLDRKRYKSFWNWVNAFFVVELNPYIRPGHVVRLIHDLKPQHVALFRKSINEVMIQREIHELFDTAWTQEPEHVVIPVTLTPSELRTYKKMVKDRWAMIAGEAVSADNPLALTTRLRQLASDWGTLDATLDDGAKVVAAAELIGDLLRREPVVVFTSYKATAHRLAARLGTKGWRADVWTGDETKEQHETVLSEYAAGEVDVVVGTLASLGEGVDGLQAHSSTVVFIDHDWVPSTNEQAVGRLRRSGQRERVSVYHLVAEGTIDVAVARACLDKTNVTQLLKNRPLLDSIYGIGFD